MVPLFDDLLEQGVRVGLCFCERVCACAVPGKELYVWICVCVCVCVWLGRGGLRVRACVTVCKARVT